MAVSCPVFVPVKNDERYLKLRDALETHFKETEESRGFPIPVTDQKIGWYLDSYQKYNHESEDWFPSDENERKALIWYVDNVFYNYKGKLPKAANVYSAYKAVHTMLTPYQLNRRISMLSRIFSDVVTTLQKKDPEKSRLDIIREQGTAEKSGYEVIMDRVYQRCRNSYSREAVEKQLEAFSDLPEAQQAEKRKKGEYRIQHMEILEELKEPLLAMVAPVVGRNEGFSINTGSFAISELDPETAENEDDTDVEVESTEGDMEEASKGDRYTDFRTLKILSSLSPQAHRLISRIPKLNSEGKYVVDDIGQYVYMSPRDTAVVLQRILVTATPKTMMSVIAQNITAYPWLRSLYHVLSKSPEDQATIYAAFKKAETTYSSVLRAGKNYKIYRLNESNAESTISREAGTNMISGYVLDEEYSVYNNAGMLRDKQTLNKLEDAATEVAVLVIKGDDFRLINTVTGFDKADPRLVEDAIKKGKEEGKPEGYYDYLSKAGSEAMRDAFEKHPGLDETIARLLRGIGINITAKDVVDAASRQMSAKYFGDNFGLTNLKYQHININALYYIVNSLATVYTSARYHLSYPETVRPHTAQYLFNTSQREYNILNTLFSFTRADQRETRTLQGQKNLATYNNTNLLHQAIDKLSNKSNLPKQEYSQMLMRDFLRYEGMSLGRGAQMRSVGWLADCEKYSGADIELLDDTGFLNTEYAKLSDVQKLTDSLLRYFDYDANGPGRAQYEVPIQSDYDSAYNFVIARYYNVGNLFSADLNEQGDNLESDLLDNLVDEVSIEMERIAALRRRSKMVGVPLPDVYMQRGMEFQIFPAFNTNGFLEQISQMDTAEAHVFMKKQIAQQLREIADNDLRRYEEAHVFENPILKKAGRDENFYSKNGLASELPQGAIDAFYEYSANVFYARSQMAKLFTGGLENFKSLIDYEKRNMMLHAPHTSLYTEAQYKGERVGKDYQSVVYVEDDQSASAVYDDIKEALHALLDDKVITHKQYESMLASYDKINTTDGVGFRTLDSHRAITLMSDPAQWTDKHEAAYQKIKHGKKLSRREIDLFISGRKPIYSGYEILPAVNGEKPIRLPVLHKYAEEVLLPVALLQYSQKAKATPLHALALAQERLAEKGKDIDMFLFTSGVKVGGHTPLAPFAKEKNENGKENPRGNRLRKDVASIAGYIENRVSDVPYSVHTLSLDYYGIAASTPAHDTKDAISMASQAEKAAYSNIRPTDSITVRGKRMNAAEGRDLFYKIKAASTIDTYQDLQKLFANRYKMRELLHSELAGQPYSSQEMYASLALINGEHDFAIPLFSPGVEHDAQMLMTSILKKRLTRPKARGANMLQATGLGVDMEWDPYANDGLPESDKLRVVFTGKGKRKGFYVEATVPVPSDLLPFADPDGGISAESLRRLVDEGKIPESILEFVAYRTPSDAEHSVLPFKIKAFTPKVDGATIRVPKEVMVMTGHDYDGDKLRCHFKNFRIKEDMGDISDQTLVKVILGKEGSSRIDTRTVVEDAYDYSKSPVDNRQRARDNAKVELLYAQLTSTEAASRMLIPGGCEETKITAKSLEILRRLKRINPEMDVQSFYNQLVMKSDKELSDMLAKLSNTESPFTLSHSLDAYQYLIRSSEMIGIYAMFNSTMQMLQRMNVSYKPVNNQQVRILNTTFGKLFAIENDAHELSTLSLARLVNAAVDNGKDPVLGYLNQSAEVAPMTFLLLSAGMNERDMHLVMNQPVVREVSSRLLVRGKKNAEAWNEVLDEVLIDLKKRSTSSDVLALANGTAQALQYVSNMKREDFIRDVVSDFSDINDENGIRNQIAVLQLFSHLRPAAEQLRTFVRLVRPESQTGALGSTLASLIKRVSELNEFRERSDSGQLRFNGMGEVLHSQKILLGQSQKDIFDGISSPLPEVTSLISLIQDNGLDMFQRYFPQAKQSWAAAAAAIATGYDYDSLSESAIQKIQRDMLVWKMYQDKKRLFPGNLEEIRQQLLFGDETHKSLPTRLRELQARMDKATSDPNSDPEAHILVGNLFLQNLAIESVDDLGRKVDRIRFNPMRVSLEGDSDLIRSYWGALAYSNDDTIKQLGLDLFKYSLFTNGFNYGRYEFGHLAPYPILRQQPEYVDAMRDILYHEDWNNPAEVENFMHQYYMNHWYDRHLIPAYLLSTINLRRAQSDAPGVFHVNATKDTNTKFAGKQYVVLTRSRDAEEGEVMRDSDYYSSGTKVTDELLYRVEPVISGDKTVEYILTLAPKLSIRSRRNQITLNYNPSISYIDMKPVISGSARTLGEYDPYATADISAPGQQADIPFGPESTAVHQQNSDIEREMALAFLPEQAVAQMFSVDSKAESADSTGENKQVQMTDSDIEEQMRQNMMSQLGVPSDAQEPAEDANEDTPTSGQMYSLVRRDENGDPHIEKVKDTPANVREVRKQRAFVELNKRLRDILREKGVSVGVLTRAEARLAIAGVTDFDTARVTAEGLIELIRLSNGIQGEEALPEEFGHVALEMLGHSHPLVSRLLTALNGSDAAMREAYNGMYDDYAAKYGAENKEKLVLEAAGKLVAKQLIHQQRIETSAVRRILDRVVNAIKGFLRQFNIHPIQDAIYDAEGIASEIARGLLSGRMLDEMLLENVTSNGIFYGIDLSGKDDIVSRLLKNEVTRLHILRKRLNGKKNAEGNPTVIATQKQIASLEQAIKTHKTEEAIISYLKESTDFIKKNQEELQDDVKAGRSAAQISRSLITIRDTIGSFYQALEDIRSAITNHEIDDPSGLYDVMGELQKRLGMLDTACDDLGVSYLEDMLEGVYGKNGVRITVGRERGRQISIKEMATQADGDISFFSRWFHSLADCNDYVLRAIDDVTRDAKRRSRARTETVRARVEAAVEKLYRETGSRDQTFMFEYKTENGKKVKTGKYISASDAAALPAAQRDFYNEMMAIKAEADKGVPVTFIEDRKIVMLRKYAYERYKSAHGVTGKLTQFWEGLKNSIMETGDDIDFEHEDVNFNFRKNKIDSLPVKFMFKGKSETYDDMTDDVATSILTYAGMANEYNEMNGVIGILENARYMASKRDVLTRSGRRIQRVRAGINDEREPNEYHFTEPLTVKQARTYLQDALNDFFDMHVYGHIQKDEGTIGRTHLSKRKLANMVNRVASYSQMALNLPQRIANVNTGHVMVAVETVGKGKFSAKDVGWAIKIWRQHIVSRLAETGKTDVSDKLSKFNEHFDIMQTNGRNLPNYSRGRLSRIFNSSLLFAGMNIGEDYLASITGLAVAHNYKVKNAEGKEETLWDAYEVAYHDTDAETGAYLRLKDGYTNLDGSPITREDEERFGKEVIGLNFELQGIYNQDDKSAVQQYILGSLVIMYRKWIAPAMKRRYQGLMDGRAAYNVLKGGFEEGYYTTLFNAIADPLFDTIQARKNAENEVSESKSISTMGRILSALRDYTTAFQMNYAKMTPYEQTNIKKALTETAILFSLGIAAFALKNLPPSDHDNDFLNWADNFLLVQILRLRTELGSMSPSPNMASEALKILNSPFAALGPIRDTSHFFALFLPSNYTTEVKSGRYRGHSKAYRHFRELPIVSMFKKVDNFLDPSPLIQFYENDEMI